MAQGYGVPQYGQPSLQPPRLGQVPAAQRPPLGYGLAGRVASQFQPRANALQGIQTPALTDSQRIMQLLQRRALRTAQNARRRGSVLTQLAGITDPNQARVAQLGLEGETSGAIASGLSDAELQQAMSDQAYQRQQADAALAFQRQKQLMAYQQRLNRPSLGGMLGGLVGQGLGAFTGNYFGGLGTRMSGTQVPGIGYPPNRMTIYNEPGPSYG